MPRDPLRVLIFRPPPRPPLQDAAILSPGFLLKAWVEGLRAEERRGEVVKNIDGPAA